MLTDADFIRYFNDIRKMELDMERAYLSLAGEIKNSSYKAIFHALARAERNHSDKVDFLINMFE